MQNTQQNRLLKMFPTPAFLSTPATGVSINDEAIRFVFLTRKGGSYVVTYAGEKKLPMGVVVDGVIQKSEELIQLLKMIREEHNIQFAHASLPDEEGYVFVTKVPATEISELKSAIEVSIEENAPVKVADTVYDYSIINNTFADGALEVVVSAMPRETVEAYCGVFEASGINVLSLQLEAHANVRTVLPFGENDTNLIVTITRLNKMSMVITRDGNIMFSSVVQMMTDNPEEVLGSLKKTISYWNVHMQEVYGVNAPVSAIWVAGGNLKLDQYAKSIKKGAELPVNMANVWENVCSLENYVPPIMNEEALAYSVAIGLALTS